MRVARPERGLLRPWRLPRADARLVLSRTIVYGTLSGAIVLIYAACVILLRALLPGETPYAVALLSTGAAALLALPLRDRLQRTVTRLMYGDRDDPYRAITRLGEQLETAPGADEVLDAIVQTVALSLRLPYVAVELGEGDVPTVAAAHGAAPAAEGLQRLPLTYRGSRVGSLILAPRSPGEAFSAADLRLLADLGRQAGPVAESVRLTSELRRSRQRLVTAREEERRRLQRDLHDGIGPTLAGALMKMETARRHLEPTPAAADRMLGELAADTRRAIDEVRRLTHDLRPPALDQLGLAGALRERAADFVGTPDQPLDTSVVVSASLPELSAAVEVAAYRISLEALTNVARHSGARRAELMLAERDGALLVEVRDDGRGPLASGNGGLGQRSMRERAEELGGSLEIAVAAGGGTLVQARLPLHGTTRE